MTNNLTARAAAKVTASSPQVAGAFYCFPYVRVSTGRQLMSGLSIEEQVRQLRSYYERVLLPEGAQWAGEYIDDDADLEAESISASKVAFCDRPIGGEINRRARRGDHIIVAKVDRIFRDWADAGVCIKMWRTRGVVVHILEYNVRTDGDPLHTELLLSIGTSVAAAESRKIGARVVEFKRSLRMNGFFQGGNCPHGFTVIRQKFGRTTHLVLVPDDDQRRVMNRILDLMDTHTQPQIAETLRAEGLVWYRTVVDGIKGNVIRKPIRIDADVVRAVHEASIKGRAARWPEHIDRNGRWILGLGKFRRTTTDPLPGYARIAQADSANLDAQ